MAFSLSPCVMLMRSAGMPQASLKSGSMSKIIIVARQRFAKSAQRDSIRSAHHGLLVVRAETLRAKIECGPGPALKSIAADEALALRSVRQIAKADHIDAVGAMRTVHRRRSLRSPAVRRSARTRCVIHQAMPQQSARIPQPGGPFACGRVQQNARRFQRLRAEDHGSYAFTSFVRFVDTDRHNVTPEARFSPFSRLTCARSRL